MEKIVFEIDVVQPRREVHRCKFELDKQQVEQLLNPIDAAIYGFEGTVDELIDLVTNSGAVSTVIALKGEQESAQQYVRNFAAKAWLNDLPWQVTNITDDGVDDARFGGLVDAYVKAIDDSEGT